MSHAHFTVYESDPATPKTHEHDLQIHNDGLDIRQGLDKLHAQFSSHHKYSCVQPICPDAFTGYYRDTLATTRRLKRARIENMMIPNSIPLKESLIIPGGRNGFILQINPGQHRSIFSWVLNPDGKLLSTRQPAECLDIS